MNETIKMETEEVQDTKKEPVDLSGRYIGDMYAEDVYAYTHMKKATDDLNANYWERETGIVVAMSEHKIGGTPFCWPAALTETLWFPYRGMIKEAIVFDAITMVLGGIVLHFSWLAGLITFLVMSIVKGFLAVPLYYLHTKDAIAKRGLLMREPKENEAVRESLSKEGKPSLKRALIYLFFKCFAAVCLESILFSVFALLGI